MELIHVLTTKQPRMTSTQMQSFSSISNMASVMSSVGNQLNFIIYIQKNLFMRIPYIFNPCASQSTVPLKSKVPPSPKA